MNVSLVMTLIGADRPGLVESISSVIADHGGNWVESRMSHLAGQFAGILRVQVARERAEDLTRAIEALQTGGLDLVIHPDADAPPDGGRDLVILELVGQDRPGIVREVTRAITRQRFNVEELRTECTCAPMTGETLFRATAKLRQAGDGSLQELRAELEKTADDLMVDIRLAEADDPAGIRLQPGTGENEKNHE